MKTHQIAAQLFTVRDHVRNSADFARSIRRLREIGYRAVQVSGVGPIPTAELAGILEGEGMTCCATHEGNILTDPAAVVERLDGLKCRYTAYPYPGGVKLETLEDVKVLAAALDRSGRVLRDAGKVLAYHNHNIEFRRFGGRTMLEIIFAETDPRFLQGEIDTYWVQYGGGDPASWCAGLAGRLPLLHMKDYVTNAQNQHAMTEIGNGNLDWKRIVGAAERSGCEWFIVEQDSCPADPFDSLRISYEYIRGTLCT